MKGSYADWLMQEKHKAAGKARRQEERRQLRKELAAARRPTRTQFGAMNNSSKRLRNAVSGHASTPVTSSLSARADHTRLALVRHSGTLSGIQRAIVRLTQEHRAPVTIGRSVGEPRYAGGVPLVADDSTLVCVFDPPVRPLHYCTFLRDVDARLMFPTNERRARFINLLTRIPPVLDYRTAVV
ncbi:hypothetical protein [Streptomyces sp. NPDC055709]